MSDVAQLERERDEAAAVARKWHRYESAAYPWGITAMLLLSHNRVWLRVLAGIAGVLWLALLVRSMRADRAEHRAWERWMRAFYYGWQR